MIRYQERYDIRSEVFTMVKIKIVVFWVVTLYHNRKNHKHDDNYFNFNIMCQVEYLSF
jgi:hypothetical protein